MSRSREAISRQLRPEFLVKDLGGLLLYYPGREVAQRVPRAWLRAAARAGGAIVGRLGVEDMRAELRAIHRDRPMPRDEEAILRDAVELAMFNELEVLRYPSLDARSIDETCRVEGREHLDAALAQGKGAIVLIGHLGANQVVMPALGHRGYRMSQLSAPPPAWAEILRDSRTTPAWERVLARRWELEQRLPVTHINVFRFLRPAFECVRRNEVLGLAFDGGGGDAFVEIELLGRRARVSAQPARLWQKTGATLLPTSVDRGVGESLHRVRIHPPLPWQGTAEASLQAYARIFEGWAWAAPEQYLHFLAMRRRVRGTDVAPFFDDYPPAPGALSRDEAAERLRRAGAAREP